MLAQETARMAEDYEDAAAVLAMFNGDTERAKRVLTLLLRELP